MANWLLCCFSGLEVAILYVWNDEKWCFWVVFLSPDSCLLVLSETEIHCREN